MAKKEILRVKGNIKEIYSKLSKTYAFIEEKFHTRIHISAITVFEVIGRKEKILMNLLRYGNATLTSDLLEDAVSLRRQLGLQISLVVQLLYFQDSLGPICPFSF